MAEKDEIFEPFLDANCKPMTLNAQTKFGMTFGQLIFLIGSVFSVSGGFYAVGSTANNANAIGIENKRDIEQIKKDAVLKNEETLKMFYEIRASQIRIEEQIKMKKDK